MASFSAKETLHTLSWSKMLYFQKSAGWQKESILGV